MNIRERLKENLHHVARLQVILKIFAKHGFASLVQELGWPSLVSSKQVKDQSPETLASRLRQAFEELGPTFIKLGQLLSTRPDIIPRDFVKEFEKLTDRITPLPYSEIQEVIETELGRPIDEVFEWIDPQPLAAASIAQVHRARLQRHLELSTTDEAQGFDVVIKVQRPGIGNTVESDIQILYVVAQALEKIRDDLKLFNLQAVVEEFQRSISEELDFVLEAKNVDVFQTLIKNQDRLCIPKVYWPYTTKRMLTMTELKGVTLSQMKEFPSHIDRKELAHSTVRFFVEGMFFHGIFHCDAHAGNLIVDASGEGRVGIVDFGMVGRLSESLKERLSRLFMALASQDFQGMAITYGELAEFGKRLSVREFQNDLEHLFAPNISRALSEVDMGEMMLESLAIAQKHRIRLPRDLILFFRAVVTLEHVGRSLDPDFKFSEFGQSFSKELLRRQFSVQSISRDLLRAVEGLRLLPSALRTLAHRIDQDELFPSSEGLESAIEGFKQSQKLIALAIVFFGSLFSAVLMSVLNAGHWSEIPLFAISGLCFLGLLFKSLKS